MVVTKAAIRSHRPLLRLLCPALTKHLWSSLVILYRRTRSPSPSCADVPSHAAQEDRLPVWLASHPVRTCPLTNCDPAPNRVRTRLRVCFLQLPLTPPSTCSPVAFGLSAYWGEGVVTGEALPSRGIHFRLSTRKQLRCLRVHNKTYCLTMLWTLVKIGG